MVVAFYFRLHLAYFPRPVVAIFARPEQRKAFQPLRHSMNSLPLWKMALLLSRLRVQLV